MNDESELRDALRIAVPVEPEDKVAERRAALVSVLQREIALSPQRVERAQSRLKLRRAVQIASIAAALAATLGLGMLVSELGTDGAPSGRVASTTEAPSNSSSGAQKDGGRESLAGRTFETKDGHQKVLQLGGGTKVVLAAHTNLFVERDTTNEQHVRLNGGALSVSVPPHQEDRSVQVTTKHATVRVTGTVFGVEVGRFSQPADSPPRTRVTVQRGQVIVDHEGGQVALEAGDIWLSPLLRSNTLSVDAASGRTYALDGSAHPRSVDRSIPVDASSRKPVGDDADGSVTDSPHAATMVADSDPGVLPRETAMRTEGRSESGSTLAAENNLLERALAAEQRGNDDKARELVERFLERYPHSPLRASALAVRKRLLESPRD